MTLRRRSLGPLLLAPALASLAPRLQAQTTWPAKPVSIVVAYAAGGGSDAVARLLAQELGPRLGQQVVVENRPGAGGNIGTAAVAKGAPDGHLLLLTPPGPIINSKLLYKSLPYDPDRELVPVARLVESPFAILVRPDFPAADLRELVAWAKANPGKLNVGTVGNGSTGHLLNLLIEHHTGTRFNIVPYKGSSQVITDLMAGRLDMTVDYPSTYVGQIESRKVRPIGTLGTTRHELLPGVGTFSEAGFQGVEATGWFALMAPRGTPPAVIQRLQKEVSEVLAQPETKAKLVPLGYSPAVLSADATRQLIERESQRLGAIVKAANLSLD